MHGDHHDTSFGYDDLPALLTRLTGDEKHDRSSLSTLDVLWVLYDRVLGEDDRFILSKGHGPTAYYAVLAAKGIIPVEALDGFGTFDSPLGYHPDRMLVRRASRSRAARSATGSASRSGVALDGPPRLRASSATGSSTRDRTGRRCSTPGGSGCRR